MYHFDCLQRMYKFDREKGNKSSCTLCRTIIMTPPIKLFNTSGFPKEPFVYSIENYDGVIQPNLSKKKSGTSSGNQIVQDAHVDERIEFYEGRLADLEAMASNYEELVDQNDDLEADLEETQEQLEITQRELDRRNLEMARISERLLESEKKSTRLESELEVVSKELDSYKYTKFSLEVERLASEIGDLQSDSYYKNILKDKNIRKDQVVSMLAGMKVKFDHVQVERDKLEKELRFFKIFKENVEKRERLKRQREDIVKMDHDKKLEQEKEKEKEEVNVKSIEDSECYIDIFHDEMKPIINPFLINSSVSSMMVPKSLPKQIKVPNGTTSTGTGKKSKIIELANGKKFFI